MTRSFPIEIVLSLTTGILLKEGGFDDMQDLAEHVLGHPVWTHEFADRATTDRMKEAVFAQHPKLRDAEPWNKDAAKKDVRPYLSGYVERAQRMFGDYLCIRAGSGERTEDPVSSLKRIAGGGK